MMRRWETGPNGAIAREGADLKSSKIRELGSGVPCISVRFHGVVPSAKQGTIAGSNMLCSGQGACQTDCTIRGMGVGEVFNPIGNASGNA